MNDITFKVGDTVSFCGLSGFVKEITEAKTLLVYFPTDGCSYEFYSDGSLYDGKEEPMLTLTHKAKKKITVECWVNLYNDSHSTVSLNEYSSIEESIRRPNSFLKTVHLSKEIEL